MKRFTLQALRELHPAACESDLRVAFDPKHPLSTRLMRDGREIPLPAFCSSREMRLLATQFNALAAHLESSESPRFEDA